MALALPRPRPLAPRPTCVRAAFPLGRCKGSLHGVTWEPSLNLVK